MAIVTPIVGGIAFGGSLLASITSLDSGTTPILAPCTPDDTRYANLFFQRTPIENWPDQYHGMVNNSIEESLESSANLECDSETSPFPKPTRTIEAIARNLPPWGTIEAQDQLTFQDSGLVLLELLRVYECALYDYKNFIRQHATNEKIEEVNQGNLSIDVLSKWTYGQREKEIQPILSMLEIELATARPSLEKALSILAGASRLQLLDGELQCLQGASLDIRNGFSLAAEASACLPRIWDSRDVLRDIDQTFYVPDATP